MPHAIKIGQQSWYLSPTQVEIQEVRECQKLVFLPCIIYTVVRKCKKMESVSCICSQFHLLISISVQLKCNFIWFYSMLILNLRKNKKRYFFHLIDADDLLADSMQLCSTCSTCTLFNCMFFNLFTTSRFAMTVYEWFLF